MKALSEKYGPHPRTIEKRKKKEGWVKGSKLKTINERSQKMAGVLFAKTSAEIKVESDNLLQKAAEVSEKLLNAKRPKILAKDLSSIVTSLTSISDKRLELRGELTPYQQAKINLDTERFNLDKDKIQVNKENPEDGEVKSMEEAIESYGL